MCCRNPPCIAAAPGLYTVLGCPLLRRDRPSRRNVCTPGTPNTHWHRPVPGQSLTSVCTLPLCVQWMSLVVAVLEPPIVVQLPAKHRLWKLSNTWMDWWLLQVVSRRNFAQRLRSLPTHSHRCGLYSKERHLCSNQRTIHLERFQHAMHIICYQLTRY